ncbi:serine recombinase [Nocardia africana]
MSAVDRMWNIRDAILAWLYEEKAANRRPARITAEQIHDAVGWSDQPISEEELIRDGNYLLEKGYIAGDGVWGPLPVNPYITVAGDDFAAQGISVRPGPPQPANTSGVTNNYHITNHGPSQTAINSSHFQQNQVIGAEQDPFNAVADALDEYAAQGHEKADDARSMADEIREAAKDPEEGAGKLRTLLATAIGVAVTAAGHEIGQQINDLAVAALQSLPV